MSSISLNNVFKRYGAVQVLHGVNLEILEGEFAVLLGPSGCGKTTTLRMVAGLEDISDGEILIGGRIMNEVAPKDRGVAMVFQNYALYPHMTVQKNMEFALRPLRLDRSEVERRISKTAEILELTRLLDRKPALLSGGQRQRVAMGRAMVRTPDVFLFDEPLSNLDAKLRTQVRWEIGKLHQRLGTTVLYVTHDQVEAMTLADKIVIMRDGYVEQVGTPEEVYTNPKTIFVASFIGSPAMNLLKARAQGGVLKAKDFSINVTDIFKKCVHEGQEITIGIRPINVSLCINSSETSLTAKVDVTEYLGNEALLNLRVGNLELVAEVPAGQRVPVGSTVQIEFNNEAMHLFDTASGQSLK